MFNPITLVALIIILGVCFITGLVYQIPTSPAITATVNGTNTRAVYTNFFSSSDTSFDSKTKLDSILEEAAAYIDIQTENTCFEFSDLQSILDDIVHKNVVTELKKYHDYRTGKYIEENDISELQTIATNLQNYVNNFQSLPELSTRLIMTETEFKTLQEVATFMYTTTNKTSIPLVLETLYSRIGYFDTLQEYRNLKLLNIDNSILAEFKTKYITTAQTKLSNIAHEMSKLNDEATNDYYVANLGELKSLITNYKMTVESVKTAVKTELNILLRNVSGTKVLFNNSNESIENMKVTLAEANFYLDNNPLYFNQYQKALNFGSASTQVTAYDHAYFIISIIGFLTIIFGIFCAYKLFGRDRKNGKLDLLLSQKVKFGEVFAGKFFALFFCTSFVLACFTVLSFIWGSILYAFLPNSILAVFNLQSGYAIAPFVFLLIKVIGIELQVVFWSVFTIFMMNMSRKFELFFGISLIIFALSTIGNIFLNGQLWYCLLPFIHADLTSFLGGATMQTGFLVTSLYASGNFFISLAYYLVVVCLLYNFTRQLFRKN